MDLPWATQLLSQLSLLRRVQINYTALAIVLPVELDAWITFNEAGELTQYDATFRWFAWTGTPGYLTLFAWMDASQPRLP